MFTTEELLCQKVIDVVRNTLRCLQVAVAHEELSVSPEKEFFEIPANIMDVDWVVFNTTLNPVLSEAAVALLEKRRRMKHYRDGKEKEIGGGKI